MDETKTGESQGGAAEQIVAEYLEAVRATHDTGAAVPETSYYPALSNLFNAVGKTLKPKVRCIININNQGAGLPDGGLFTADQFQRQADSVPQPGQLPARGAIEAKGTKPDIGDIVGTVQVKTYLVKYGIVIVCNMREFVIVERGPNGLPIERESFKLAESERDFWHNKAARPRSTAKSNGGPFIEFIKRACLHAAPLTERQFSAEELAAITADATTRGLTAGDLARLLGGLTCDVHLNNRAYWRNVPPTVWEYYIGGYQVIKKWLSYREHGVLGRDLRPEEVREVMNMARRISAIILLQPKLDENYRSVVAATFNWTAAF